MASLWDRFKSFFLLNSSKKLPSLPSYIKTSEDPEITWDILQQIGDGAFGKIFKAVNRAAGVEAAVKRVHISDVSDITDHTVEIDILSKCSHPNIIQLLDAFYYEDYLSIYLEFCSGGAIDAIMHELERNLSEPEIRSCCRQMCSALEYLHSNGIMHRDIKAGNVLLTTQGRVKLADFGVSATDENENQKHTTFIGTPYWMAPEVIACETAKDEPYDCRADIWSLGVTVIEFAQMEPPYNNMNPSRVLMKIRLGDPPGLDFPHKWSTEMNEFVTKCLQKNPRDRPSAKQLLDLTFLSPESGDNVALVELLMEVKADVTVQVTDVDSVDLINSLCSDNQSTDELQLTTMDDSTTRAEALAESNESVTCVDTITAAGRPSSYTQSALITNNTPQPVDYVDTVDVSVETINTKSAADVDNSHQIEVRGQEDWHRDREPTALDWQRGRGSAAVNQVADSEPVVTDRQSSVKWAHGGDTGLKYVENSSRKNQEEEEQLVKLKMDEEEEEEDDSHILRAHSAALSGTKTHQSQNYFNSKAGSGYGVILGPTNEGQFSEVAVLSAGSNGVNFDPRAPDSGTVLPAAAGPGTVFPAGRMPLVRHDAIGLYPGADGMNGGNFESNFSRQKAHYQSLTKTRRYVYEGQVVTRQSTRVIVSGTENSEQQERQTRKAELRALQMLQRAENRQREELAEKIAAQRHGLDQQLDQRRQTLIRSYADDVEKLDREHRQKVKKVESTFSRRYQQITAQLKSKQNIDLKELQDSHRRTLKRSRRSEDSSAPYKLQQLELEFAEKERTFTEQQKAVMELTQQKLIIEHRNNLVAEDLNLLNQKHQLMRCREAALWEAEETHLLELGSLANNYIQQLYELQRRQLNFRRTQEMDITVRTNERQVAALQRRHAADRKQQTKRDKKQWRAQRQSMCDQQGVDPQDIKKFDEMVKRKSSESLEREEKSREEELRRLEARNASILNDLDQLFLTRQMQLNEQEVNATKEEEIKQKHEQIKFRDELVQRKKRLENEFTRERLQFDPSSKLITESTQQQPLNLFTEPTQQKDKMRLDDIFGEQVSTVF